MEDLFKLDDQWHIHTLDLRDGNRLRWAIRLPKKSLKNLFVFVNGRLEFIEKYGYFAQDIEEDPLGAHSGFLTWDHRGQGKSSGLQYHIDDFQTFVEDGLKVIEEAKAKYKVNSYVMMSHSLGGLIAVTGIMQGIFTPERLVLSSPLLGLPPGVSLTPTLRKSLLHMLTLLKYQKSRFPVKRSHFDWANNKLTYCPHRYQRIIRSPFGDKEPTFGWIDAIDKAIDACFEIDKATRWQIPTLVLLSEDERVVHPSAAIKWCELLQKQGSKNIRYEAISHSRHELLSERPETYSRVVELIKSHLLLP